MSKKPQKQAEEQVADSAPEQEQAVESAAPEQETATEQAEESANDQTDAVSKKAKSKKEKGVEVEKEEGVVFFASANKEVSSFDIVVAQQEIKSQWDTKRERLVFRVPTDLAERFRMHDHVQSGRVVEVEEV